ncbi:hypothetical protein IWQ56_003214 [Coemansia nantahalensis]|nr:hypothetical protein IWQ56_003214 [Coemansia nantahalensis]
MDSEWSTASSDGGDASGSTDGVASESASESAEELHDGQADERDAVWVAKRFPGATDAVLSCPLCFTQICFVCQHHVRFPGQYRAREVAHCRTLEDKLYVFGKRGRLEPAPDGAPQGSEVFRLVVCAECGARVGVVDADGAYHLFEVVAGS